MGAAKAASEELRSLHGGTYHAGYVCCRYLTACFGEGSDIQNRALEMKAIAAEMPSKTHKETRPA